MPIDFPEVVGIFHHCKKQLACEHPWSVLVIMKLSMYAFIKFLWFLCCWQLAGIKDIEKNILHYHHNF